MADSNDRLLQRESPDAEYVYADAPPRPIVASQHGLRSRTPVIDGFGVHCVDWVCDCGFEQRCLEDELLEQLREHILQSNDDSFPRVVKPATPVPDDKVEPETKVLTFVRYLDSGEMKEQVFTYGVRSSKTDYLGLVHWENVTVYARDNTRSYRSRFYPKKTKVIDWAIRPENIVSITVVPVEVIDREEVAVAPIRPKATPGRVWG